MLSELALIPAEAVKPFTGLYQGRLGLYPGNDLNNRSSVGELDAVEFFDASFGDVGMRVDQTRRGGVAVKVDDADTGGFACKLQNFRIAAHLYEHALADRDGLSNRIPGIHSKDVAVKQYQVGGSALRDKDASEQQGQQQEAC